jgi:acyl transferase domain-containing protein/NADP-dependent 3-hydroxy acid dehydrogenase YdfG
MNHTADQRRVPVAVIGASALFPGSVDATGFWRNILEGNDLLTDVPESHWLISDYYDPDPSVPDKTYAKRGAFLPEVDFDSLAWGVPPSIVPETDTSQLLALIVAQKLLDDATGGDESRIDRATTSVILGVTSGQELFGSMVARLQRPVWVKALRESGIPEDEVSEICDRIVAQYAPWNESTFPGLLGNVVAGRIANRLNLGGTNCVTDAACASSFAAIAMGLNELYLGDSEVVLAGGVDTMNDIFMYMCFSKTPALSPSGDCRPFSEQADGTMLGEGLGMVALKRLDDAERDGDRVYAVIDSVGTSSDGRSKSVYAPVSAGQALALRRAYERAGHGPGEVELVEAHGTGTVAGDAAEFGGLALAFDEADRDDRQWCALGSVKSQIGHTKAAAGAAGLIKAIMALHHQVLPPTLKIDRPNPKLELEQSPFHFATRSRPWVRGSDHPRRASVSSFGFGGSNYHLALSEYTGTEPLESDVARSAAPADRLRSMPAELVALSAGSPAELVAAARALAADSLDGGRLAYVAHESQLAFDPSSAARLAVVATDEADLAQRLTQVAERIEASPDETLALNGVVHYSNHPRTDGDTAFVFSGQGSQRIDMGGDLAMQFRRAIEAWDLAADLGAEGTPPLHRVVFPPSAFTEEDRDAASARLSSTEWAQPAIGCTSLSMLRLLASLGLEAQRFAGHSFGEITALHAAGALSAEALIAVARRRGELMAEAATVPGAMLAVSESIDQVQSLLDDWGVPVVVANHNSPKQVVLSGATDDIEAVSDKLSGVGIAVKRLPVATAFHSTIVAGASEGFTDYLGGVDISAPAGAVYSNLTARQYENDPEEIRGRLGAQLAAPVRYVEMIEQMYADGARTFVEVGPGSIQAGLIRQILADRPHLAVSLDRPGRNGVTSLLGALAELAVAGHRFDFEALWEGFGVPSDPRDEVRAKVAVRINGANHGRPYPPAGGAAALPAPNPPRPARAEPPVGSEWGGAADSLRPSMSPPPAADDRIPMMAPPSHAQAPSHPVASTAGRGPEPSTEAFFESQRQTAHAHEVYLRTMADAHAAFLDAMRVTIEPPGPHAVAQALAAMPPAPVEAPTHLSSGAATTAVPAASAVSPAVAGAEVTAPDVATGPLAADPVPGPAAGGDLAAVLLEVVSDKTGYPVEMLGLDLELEGDLGIDSIKRVEILSEMTDREPSLPEFDTAVLAELQTLGQVLEHMSSALGREPVATGPLAADPVPGPAATAAPKGASTNGTGGSVGDPPERHVIEAVPAAPSGLAPVGLHGPGSLLITGGDRPLVDALVAALAERGVDAVGHEVAAEVATDAAGLVVLGAIGGVPAIDAAIAVNRAAFAAARSFGRVRGGDVPAVFVTVQDTGGAFGLTGFEPSLAWAAGLASLARTAHLEWPSVSAKAIDIAGGSRSVTELAALLADEIVHGGPDLEVGIGPDGTRLVLVNRPAAPLGPRSEPSLEAGDVVVASGGARGVTAAALVDLAGRLPLRFVLLGRTELTDEPACTVGVRGDAELKRALHTSASAAGTTPRPSELGRQVEGILAGREVRATIAAIEAAGSTVRYVVADVASAESVRGALADVRATWGSIRGLVHGAGVLADKLIVDKTDDQFARVFDTKVAGLRSLLSATADDPLRLIAVFSSVAARCGNPGQVDYAMANEVLNKVASAEARRRSGECLVKSFGWGPWDGGMVNPQLKSHFESMGVPLIGIAEGARLFADEALWGSPSEVELVVGGSPDSAVLNPDSAPRAQRCEVLVGRASHPYLVDHTVNGTTVLPFALALEWMTRAAGAFRPDLHLAALREVRVTKGVLLPEFDETERRLWISCEGTTSETDRAVVSIELTDACGTVHYKAVAELGAEEPPWPEMNGHLHELDAAGWDASDPYDSDVLFHGPKFRVISSIGAISDQGAVARMLDSHSVGWHTPGAGGSNPPLDGGFWLTDPAAIDGALQLALLWCERALGGSSLPTAIEAVRTWRASALDEPINCTLVGRQASGKRSVSDVLMFDGAGSPVAELIGIETHLVALRPSGG